MTKHKNVIRGTKRCEATIRKWGNGEQCKNPAEYLENGHYYCVTHYGIKVGYRYGEKATWD